jgi:addiction module HigA family antidote
MFNELSPFHSYVDCIFTNKLQLSVPTTAQPTPKTLIMSITTRQGEQTHDHEEPPRTPGGVVLRQYIEPLGLMITDAAEALGVTLNTCSELVNGKRGISPEMAVRLAKVFGGTEDGWLIQQARYDLAHVQRCRLKLKRLKLA